MKNFPEDKELEQGLSKVQFEMEVPISLFKNTKYFILEEVEFEINKIPYKLNKFPSLRNLHLSVTSTPKMNLYNSGFINQFENSLYLDFLDINYFFFEIEICDPKSFIQE